jgi:hypothetical protein
VKPKSQRFLALVSPFDPTSHFSALGTSTAPSCVPNDQYCDCSAAMCEDGAVFVGYERVHNCHISRSLGYGDSCWLSPTSHCNVPIACQHAYTTGFYMYLAVECVLCLLGSECSSACGERNVALSHIFGNLRGIRGSEARIACLPLFHINTHKSYLLLSK